MDRAELIKRLRNLGTGAEKPDNPKLDVSGVLGLWAVDEIWWEMPSPTNWPEYSGHLSYPVPWRGGVPPKTTLVGVRNAAAKAFLFADDLWSGPYGCARRRYCLWLADELEAGKCE